MKRTAAIMTGDGKVKTRREELPELKDNEVLIKVHASLISPSTEMAGVKGKRENPKPEEEDRNFGYANAGEIIEVKDYMKVSQDGHIMGNVVLGGGAHAGNLNIKAVSRTGPGYHDSEYGKDYPNAFVQFTTQRNLREVISLISGKRLLVDPMTTHTMPLEEVGKAADLLINSPDKAMGIILKMSH